MEVHKVVVQREAQQQLVLLLVLRLSLPQMLLLDNSNRAALQVVCQKVWLIHTLAKARIKKRCCLQH